MKKLTILLGLSCSLLTGYAQERKFELKDERKTDKSIEISYTKTEPGYYTVVLNFSELTNTSRPQEIISVSGNTGNLLTLKPTDPNQHVGYRYRYQYIRGKYKPRFNADFCYLLPYTQGTNCEVIEAGYANQKYFGAEKPADWKSYFFYTGKEELVTAIRKGLVVEVVDEFETRENVEFTTSQNAVIVEHEDGTLVRYLGFKKGSLKVEAGDQVFPNTPLGLNTFRSKDRFGISIFMYYLNSLDFESLRNQTLVKQKSLYAILTPKFITENNQCMVLENRKTYTAYSSKEIVTKEMSKRELKKYNGK